MIHLFKKQQPKLTYEARKALAIQELEQQLYEERCQYALKQQQTFLRSHHELIEQVIEQEALKLQAHINKIIQDDDQGDQGAPVALPSR